MNTSIKGKTIMKKMLLIFSALIGSMAIADDFVIATGGEGGNYERLGKELAVEINRQTERLSVQIDTEVINTNGSGENIELLSSGGAQAALVQADALSVSKPSVPIRAKSAYSESVFWIFNTDHGKEDLSDIEGSEEFLVVIVEDSGAEFTLSNFALQDSGYTKNKELAVLAIDTYDAADIVSEGRYKNKKVAGMLYVGGSIPKEIGADFKNLAVGELTDSDFNDAEDINGDDLYSNCNIENHQTAGLKTATIFNPDTICVKAMVVYSTEFENRETERAVKKAINKTLRGIQ